ncbi:MAG: GNAT family protein [Alphaproteobacteria bacterium]|nr:GNAT family protein [Alphaproteobacteria bacterium]
MSLFLTALPDIVVRGERVEIAPPLRSDYLAWSQLRSDSRAFLAPWEPIWVSDALTRTGWRRRYRRIVEEWGAGTGYHFHIYLRSESGLSENRRATALGNNSETPRFFATVPDRAGTLLVGGITLSHVRRGAAQSGTIGYWIGKPYSNRGYMTEALRLVIRFAFEELGLHRLDAACLPNNTASLALLRRVGFTEEGYARQYLKIGGAWEDHITFGLLAEDLE